MLLGALVVGVALVWALAGGRGLRPRLPPVNWLPVVLFGVVGQFLLARGYPDGSWAVAVAVTSHAGLLAGGIVNFRLPGTAALTAGTLSNAAVMLANGGMPVSGRAVVALGADPGVLPPAGHHHLMTASSRLPWLGDVLGLSWFDLVVSPGDALLVVGGVALLTATLTGEVD